MSDTKDPRPGLAAGSGGLDRRVREDLERMQVEALLARQDAGAEITRQLEGETRAELDLAEIAGVLNRLEGPVVPTFNELEDLLVASESQGFQIEKNLLTDLLREGREGHTIFKKGLVFLKHRKYDQAVEWWSLNRAGLDAKVSRLHLLLLIMECMTYFWAGDQERSQELRGQVRAHPLYRGA